MREAVKSKRYEVDKKGWAKCFQCRTTIEVPFEWTLERKRIFCCLTYAKQAGEKWANQ